MLTSTASHGKVFTTIQILRGLAALIVVFFHLTLADERHGKPLILGGLLQNGYAGVDLFFVISGFVIMHTSHRHFGEPAYFGTYFRKRLIRIYPIYWVTLVLIISGTLLAEFVAQKSLDFLPTSWPLYVSSFLLLPGHPMINGVTWSLSYELYYYLIFGLLILSGRLWPVVVGILLLSGLALINPSLIVSYPVLFSYLFSPYNLEFAAGVLAWWVIHRFRLNTSVYLLFLVVSGGILMLHDAISFEEVSKRVTFYGTSSFFLLLSLTGQEVNGWQKSNDFSRLLMKIGDASYLIYILHFPLLPIYGRLISPLLKNLVAQNIAAGLFVAVITFVSIDFHNRFEVPLVKKLTMFFTPVKPKKQSELTNR